MLAHPLTLILHLALLAGPPMALPSLPAGTPVHLGISLRFTHAEELESLRRDQQDPRAKDFRRWLTPKEFGERFGQPDGLYAELGQWLRQAGLTVTPYPNRLFVGAQGTAQQVEALLGARLGPVQGRPASVHQLLSSPRLPPAFAPVVLNISGLDTRIRYQRRLQTPMGDTTMGPQDLRHFYGLQPLLDQGYVGQGQKLAVLSTAAPPGMAPNPVAITYYLRNVAGSRAAFVTHVIPNPQNDVDDQPGSDVEFAMDVEMQSVAVPGAESLTLVVAPSSEVFTTGANEIVNHLPQTTAVSISLGICEANQLRVNQMLGFDEIAAMRQAVIQGVTEGQTWSAASGDNGANDCQNGGSPSVDYPSSIPEMVSLGGSQLSSPVWNAHQALTGYQQEATWNDGARGGAGGGGVSSVFAMPAYQAGLGLPGHMRSVPDLALMAGVPAVAVAATVPPGPMDPVQGTSAASPLSAGFFALIASRVGCRLGDVHATLYALGAAQMDGGVRVFHDITTGNLNNGGVTGPVAGPGYDTATGWGSLDVAAIAAAWPPCPTTLPDGGVLDAGALVLVPYLPCEFLSCDGGTTCTTLPDGPSACVRTCNLSKPTGCPQASVCSGTTIFSPSGRGACVAGCSADLDCAEQPGTVCSLCAHTCVATGQAAAKIGDTCTNDTDCPSGGFCASSRMFPGGYCAMDCSASAAAGEVCSCPSGAVCGTVGRGGSLCLAGCKSVGQACGGRDGYVCQPQTSSPPTCLPACELLHYGNNQTFDSCSFLGSDQACDVATGICGGPVPVVDAGGFDAGPPEPVIIPAYSEDLGARNKPCGCSAGGAGQVGLLALVALLWRRSKKDLTQ